MGQASKLQHSLKSRHVTMIALGGVIGAGLFIGSGAVISTAGPGAIFSYLIGGGLMALVMLMLGEMAATQPDSGSFSTYSTRYVGAWAGYTVGWLYWFKWMITITVEALLLGGLLNDFVPSVSVPVGSFGMLVVVILSNVFSVRSFGEFEYWLSFIKISTIFAFFLLGVSILLGFQRNIPAPGLHNILEEGGLFPTGISPILAGVTIVIFSLAGGEIAAIAAGESENPRKNIIRAMRTILARVGIFYVGSIGILVLCIPWRNKAALASPYVALFEMSGLHAAAMTMKVILFVSFLSVMNSGVYTASRMLFSLGQRGYAPRLFGSTTSNGIPLNALLLSMVLCASILTLHFATPGSLFLVLAKSSGIFILMIWIFIVGAHFRMNQGARTPASGVRVLNIRLYPWANVIAMGQSSLS